MKNLPATVCKFFLIFRLPILLLIFVILIVAKPVFSADYEKGVDASLRGDFKTAMKEWKPLAERGGATSQFQVGWLYNEGKGVTKNYETAVKWYRLAAVQGYAYAQSRLGRMYEGGYGVSQNYILAYMWFSIAAMQWDKDAGKMRDKVTKHLTTAQLKTAQELARECVRKKYKGC
jgi:TPR repeat protein